MNENPEGTPNPLNPNPVNPEIAPTPKPVVGPVTQAPPAPMPGSAAEVVPPAPMPGSAVEPTAPAAGPMNQVPVNPMQGSVAEPVPVTMGTAPVAPEMEPKGSVVEPATKKKSSKTVAIVLAILFLLIAIGCGVAAFLIAKPFGGKDAVPAAISKLLKGAPDIAMINGDINVALSGSEIPVSNVAVNFEAEINNASNENYIDASITATPIDGSKDLSFSANEIHTSEGNLYLKLTGISSLLQQYLMSANELEEYNYYEDCDIEDGLDCIEIAEEISQKTESNCIGDATGMTNCGNTDYSYTYSTMSDSMISSSLGLLDFIDGQWILIPDSNFSNLTSLIGSDIKTQCLINAAGTLGKYGNDFADIYEENPFVTYSTDNITVTKKKNTVYRLGFDADKMADFINAMNNSGFANELNSCMGYLASNEDVEADDLAEIIAKIPDIYVEIDDNDNFTRVYMELEAGEDCGDCVYTTIIEPTAAKITADLSFSYPDSIVIEEPDDYIDITSVLSQAFGQIYGTSFDQPEWINCQPPLSESEDAICEEAKASDYPYIVY